MPGGGMLVVGFSFTENKCVKHLYWSVFEHLKTTYTHMSYWHGWLYTFST